jgi:hypothetical protein
MCRRNVERNWRRSDAFTGRRPPTTLDDRQVDRSLAEREIDSTAALVMRKRCPRADAADGSALR